MRSVMTLPALPTSAHDARQFVHDTLDHWHADTDIDDAELVVSELVTSATRSEGPDVTVAVTWNATGIWIDVADNGVDPDSTRIVVDQHSFETGRALTVVDSVAQSWGVIPTDHGKRIWVHMPDARHLPEKDVARHLISGYVHRIEQGDHEHGSTSVVSQISHLDKDALRQVMDELAHIAAELVCLCSLYEDTDTVDFWDAQVERMKSADRRSNRLTHSRDIHRLAN